MALVLNVFMKMKEKKYRKADTILLAAFVLAGAIFALVLLLGQREGTFVEVRVSGRIVERYSLQDTVRYEITGVDGGKNLLLIENGEAWIAEADCPDALCRQMGTIHAVGQSVVCLPHEVVVEITGETTEQDGVDMVTG